MNFRKKVPVAWHSSGGKCWQTILFYLNASKNWKYRKLEDATTGLLPCTVERVNFYMLFCPDFLLDGTYPPSSWLTLNRRKVVVLHCILDKHEADYDYGGAWASA
jgi:hypothetical protein